jgi:alkylhydroperoxidase family enzyme
MFMRLADDTQARIEDRHAAVLGQPPRLPPVDREEVGAAVRAVTDRLLQGIARSGPDLATVPLEAIPEIMFTLCRYPQLWQSIIDVTVQIQGANALLPARDRKLAILRVGWLCQAPYEFGEHVAQARRLGFGSEEIERIVVGSRDPGWDDHERAVLRAAEELHEDAMVSDATWAQLSARLDGQQLFELLVVIGQFTATAYFQNALRLRLEPGNQGLASR